MPVDFNAAHKNKSSFVYHYLLPGVNWQLLNVLHFDHLIVYSALLLFLQLVKVQMMSGKHKNHVEF